jgi:hypothetical protein
MSHMSFPPRSPSVKVGGICILARVIDKIRLQAAGQLPAGYHVGVLPANRTFDDRLCKFLHIDFAALSQRVLHGGGSDEEVLAWCISTGHQPDAEQIEVWNAFMEKRGWNDSASAGLAKQKAEAHLGHRDDIHTFFQLMDAEEGHTA